jgi:probable HAF family extracellular repeat protein
VVASKSGGLVFTFDGSNYTYFSNLGGVSSGSVQDVGSIDDSGIVAFDYSTGGTTSGGLYSTSGNTETSFTYPGASYTLVYGGSANGMVAGFYLDSSSNQFGYVKNGNSYSSISYPGPHGQIYVWGVNDSGDAVGLSSCCRQGVSFLKKGSAYTTVSVAGSSYTEAQGLNDQDQVVGWYDNGDSVLHGFVWSNGTSSTVDYPGATSVYLDKINANGVILGGATDATGQFLFLATPQNTPEPGSGLLVAMGIGMTTLARRMRSR